jgi:hypothetical protein
MSTKKRRIATYIPTEIEDKFQAFKRERGVGDSQALILILTEFLGVSQEVAYSSELLEKIKSKLLSELRSELVKESEKLEAELSKKIGDLKSELLSKPLSGVELEKVGKPSKQQKSSIPDVGATNLGDRSGGGLTGTELSRRLKYDSSNLVKMAKRSTREKFANWSQERDPEAIGWELRKDKRYYPLPASLSEGEAEAQSSHP